MINCIDCISNELIQIVVDDNLLVSKKNIETNDNETIFLGPGFLDLQINGFSGVDFNTFPILEDDFLNVINNLAKAGVLSFFPTVITNSDSNIINLLKNINELCLKNPLINSYINGIHLEGPFISPVKEASGAHSKDYIKAPDWELFKVFQEASGNRIKIITLSPEWDNSIDFIKKCAVDNIVVSIGHTVASNEQIKAAVNAGATMSTHLGNGAPLSLHRNSNIIFDQLANTELTPSIIADGFHLPDNFLKIVLKVKKNKVILVSDSTMFAGMETGVYQSHIGGKVTLEKGGRLSMCSNKNMLAGSAVSLLDCVNKLFSSNMLSLSEAWSLASIQPKKLVNIRDTDNDFVLFKLKNNSISILSVFKSGKQIFINN
nr:N-acetylglucosamine-6-phosphate deacetylase [Mariniflexile sp. KMM 9835]